MRLTSEKPTGIRVRRSAGNEITFSFPEFVRAIRAGDIRAGDQARSWIVTRDRWVTVGGMRIYAIVTDPSFPDDSPLLTEDPELVASTLDEAPVPTMQMHAQPMPPWWHMEGDPPPIAMDEPTKPVRVPALLILFISCFIIPLGDCLYVWSSIYHTAAVVPLSDEAAVTIAGIFASACGLIFGGLAIWGAHLVLLGRRAAGIAAALWLPALLLLISTACGAGGAMLEWLFPWLIGFAALAIWLRVQVRRRPHVAGG